MINAVIIDDEKKSREVLKRLLKESDLEVTIIGEADSVESGEIIIREVEPQLVFLDVEMLDGTGFNLLEQFEEIEFKVIFITAYDKYAVKAFKYSVVDYLLKPIGVEGLEKAVLEVEKGINKEINYHDQMKALINNSKKDKDKTLGIKSATKIEFINVEDVLYCEADESYSTITLLDDTKIISSKGLKYFDSILCEYENFFRTSKSCLINLKYIKTYIKSKDLIELKTGVLIELSRRRKKEFLEQMLTI